MGVFSTCAAWYGSHWSHEAIVLSGCIFWSEPFRSKRVWATSLRGFVPVTDITNRSSHSFLSQWNLYCSLCVRRVGHSCKVLLSYFWSPYQGASQVSTNQDISCHHHMATTCSFLPALAPIGPCLWSTNSLEPSHHGPHGSLWGQHGDILQMPLKLSVRQYSSVNTE